MNAGGLFHDVERTNGEQHGCSHNQDDCELLTEARTAEEVREDRLCPITAPGAPSGQLLPKDCHEESMTPCSLCDKQVTLNFARNIGRPNQVGTRVRGRPNQVGSRVGGAAGPRHAA